MPTKSGPSPQTEPTRKKFGGDSVVWSCCGTLKGMILGFEGGFVGSTDRANETRQRNCVDLKFTQSLNQTFGRSIDFHHALHEFFLGCRKTMEVSIWSRSLFQHIWRVEQSAYHGIFHKFSEIQVLRESCLFVAVLNPSSIYDNSN